jgi:hypothetical protein
MEGTPDKPEGTEQHPPDQNSERQGPASEPEPASKEGGKVEPATPEPRPETAPGEPGITNPKQGKV